MIVIPVLCQDLGLSVFIFTFNLRTFQIITKIHQIHQIALDRFPVNLHSIFGFQFLYDILLIHCMFGIRVFPKNLKDTDIHHFLSIYHVCTHKYSFLPLIMVKLSLRLKLREALLSECLI